MKFKEFFENYSLLFTCGKADAITDLYVFPMVFFAEDGNTVSFDKNEFTENSNKLIGIYNKLKVLEVKFDIISEQSLSSHLSLVSINWKFRSETSPIYDCITRYVLIEDSSRLKIKAVIVVNETTKLNKLLN